jgi:ATP-binding cassette subfamily B protein
LYEVTEGKILLNDQDIRDMAQADLRRQMAVILQDGFLFAGDVKGNITLGEPYSLEQVKTAAAQTNVAQFIERLPQGYDTELRQRGTNLSGGEKQRVAIVRAILQKPEWLFLDEATSALDEDAEAAVYALLKQSLPDTTIISIGHRASLAGLHDRRVAIERAPGGGRIVDASLAAFGETSL